MGGSCGVCGQLSVLKPLCSYLDQDECVMEDKESGRGPQPVCTLIPAEEACSPGLWDGAALLLSSGPC